MLIEEEKKGKAAPATPSTAAPAAVPTSSSAPASAPSSALTASSSMSLAARVQGWRRLETLRPQFLQAVRSAVLAFDSKLPAQSHPKALPELKIVVLITWDAASAADADADKAALNAVGVILLSCDIASASLIILMRAVSRGCLCTCLCWVMPSKGRLRCSWRWRRAPMRWPKTRCGSGMVLVAAAASLLCWALLHYVSFLPPDKAKH
jgi:hypothetical protein